MWKRLLPVYLLTFIGILYAGMALLALWFGESQGSQAYGAAGMVAVMVASVLPLYEERIHRLEEELKRRDRNAPA